MAETTMAPADLALAERSMPVGCRFHPTDQELVGHYLGHKLRADDPFIHDTIPEFGLCKGEPWDLLEWATSASAVKFDESQCYFFSPRDPKYSNSTRSNRATLGGFWKLTGRDRKITSKGTNKVIGTKKTLVYYEGRVPRAIKTNWITHEYEYHDDKLSHDQRSHVLCWLRKDNEKKTKQKTHQLVDDYGSQAIICMNSDEHCMSSMIQGSSESSEVIDSMIQMPFGSNEAVESMIQVSSQSNRTIDSMIQIPFESNEVIDSLIELSSQSNGAIDPMIQILFESNEVVDSSQSNEAIDSMIQKLFESRL
ncbi:hypothetical protein QN277_022185 [Acacia crassicarpa]|nr:hypothetical protein QN277_022185 [Acacia crassicarpa]